jgi:hypothetical protein
VVSAVEVSTVGYLLWNLLSPSCTHYPLQWNLLSLLNTIVGIGLTEAMITTGEFSQLELLYVLVALLCKVLLIELLYVLVALVQSAMPLALALSFTPAPPPDTLPHTFTRTHSHTHSVPLPPPQLLQGPLMAHYLAMVESKVRYTLYTILYTLHSYTMHYLAMV